MPQATIRQVILLGISHHIQRGDWTVPEEEVNNFRAQVRNLALFHQVSGIAEEMSLEAMQIWKANEILWRRGKRWSQDDEKSAVIEELQCVPLPSIPEKVAQDLGLPYAACDPDSAEKRARGIHELDGYLLNPDLRDPDDHGNPEDLWRTVDFPLREAIWIERILKFDCWPVLYLCGKEHVEGFARRLDSHGIKVQIVDD